MDEFLKKLLESAKSAKQTDPRSEARMLGSTQAPFDPALNKGYQSGASLDTPKVPDVQLPPELRNLNDQVKMNQSAELVNLLQTPDQLTAADPHEDPNDMFNKVKRFRRISELMKK